MSSTSAAEPLIEPQTQAWLDSVADEEGPPIYDLAPAAARQVLRHAQADAPVDLAPAQIEDRTIDGGPTGSVELRIYRPEGATGPLPLVLHTHGGGWILGDKDTHERLDRELTGLTGAMIVFVDYTPAPDAQYPVQNEQAYTALLWAVDHAGEIGADAGRFALLGDSVGGNMAAALTLMLKERGGPQPEAQVLFYPVTDHGLDTGSYRAFADGPWLTRRAMTWFWDAYLPDVAARDAPTVSPFARVAGRALGPAAGAGDHRRQRRPARRGRGLRPPPRGGRQHGHAGPLRRHDPRLRPAQPDRRDAGAARRDPAGGGLPAQGVRDGVASGPWIGSPAGACAATSASSRRAARTGSASATASTAASTTARCSSRRRSSARTR
jgi:acetyl esterase